MISLGDFTTSTKTSQNTHPEVRAAGETTERIPAGPRHQQHQVYAPTETRRGDKTKTRVCPLHFSPTCPLLPLHAAVCGCFLSLRAEEYMTAFLYNAEMLICPSQGIHGEAGVKESRDCGKNLPGGTADEEQREAKDRAALNQKASVPEESKRRVQDLLGAQPSISHRRKIHSSECSQHVYRE